MESINFIVGLVIGLVAGRYWRAKSNIGTVNAVRQEKRDESLVKIMAMFENRSEISNDDVEKFLDVSNSTAFNYLAELEKEGKITQIGDTGRGVSYKRSG